MRKQIAATGFVLFSFLLPVKALATSFSQMYVFGDSLSDPGNVFNLTGGQIPPPPYFNGRFSNGPNWIDYLGQDLNLTPTPYTELTQVLPTQGINFAYGGATTGLDNTIIPGAPALQQQISLFSNWIQTNTPSSDALYVLWAGANDYLPTQSSFQPFNQPDVPISNLTLALSTLANAGAKNFLVANLPDLGDLPSTSNTPISSSLNTLTALHNTSLTNTLNTLSQTVGSNLNIKQLDVNSLLSDAITNPAKYGFTNVTNACISNLNCVFGGPSVQNQYLFWDNIHPTTASHKQIADLAFNELHSEPIPEPTSILGTVVFGALITGWRLKHKSKQLSAVKGSKVVD